MTKRSWRASHGVCDVGVAVHPGARHARGVCMHRLLHLWPVKVYLHFVIYTWVIVTCMSNTTREFVKFEFGTLELMALLA